MDPGLDGEHAGVDAGDARNPLVLEEVVERLAGGGVARHLAQLPDDEGPRLDMWGLEGRGVDAVVPDEGVGHHQDLPAVRRVRKGLAVARHVRVEDELSVGGAFRTKCVPLDDGSVLEDQDASHPTTWGG